MKYRHYAVIISVLTIYSCTEVPPMGVNEFEKPVVQVTVSFTSENGATIKWQDNSVGLAHYRIERRDPGETEYKLSGEAQNGATVFTDPFLVQANKAYTYRVQAIDDLNTTSYSSPIQSWLSFWPPAQLQVLSISSSTAQITWYYYHTIEKGFRIEQSINGNRFMDAATNDMNNKTYLASQLDTTNAYAYRIYAYTDINISYADSIKMQYKSSQWRSVTW